MIEHTTVNSTPATARIGDIIIGGFHIEVEEVIVNLQGENPV